MSTLQEYNILKHFPWHSYSFQMLTVEHNHIEPQRSYIRELLESHGYVFQQEKFVDDWWAYLLSEKCARRLQDFVSDIGWLPGPKHVAQQRAPNVSDGAHCSMLACAGMLRAMRRTGWPPH